MEVDAVEVGAGTLWDIIRPSSHMVRRRTLEGASSLRNTHTRRRAAEHRECSGYRDSQERCHPDSRRYRPACYSICRTVVWDSSEVGTNSGRECNSVKECSNRDRECNSNEGCHNDREDNNDKASLNHHIRSMEAWVWVWVWHHKSGMYPTLGQMESRTITTDGGRVEEDRERWIDGRGRAREEETIEEEEIGDTIAIETVNEENGVESEEIGIGNANGMEVVEEIEIETMDIGTIAIITGREAAARGITMTIGKGRGDDIYTGITIYIHIPKVFVNE